MTHEQRQYLRGLIGRKVEIDSSGKMGKIVSVNVTSDGFIIGHTKPGYDRGVFIGRLPKPALACPITFTRAEPPEPSYRPISKRGGT